MATRTVSNAGGNWNATAAWTGGVVPVAGDDVNFTATSGNLIVNVSTASLTGIDFSNYVGTITFSNTINTSGTVNFGTGGYTQAGAGANGLTINGAATLTTNGVVWSRRLAFTGTNITYTLADDLTITGTLTFGGTGTSTTINGNTIFIGGSFQTTTLAFVAGTTSLVFNGTGTWTSVSTGAIRLNLNINTSGTLSLSSSVHYNTGTLTYTAGTVITTGTTLRIGASTILSTDGIIWNSVLASGSPNISLLSDLTLTGTLTINNASSTSFTLNGNNIISSSANLVVNNNLTFTVPQDLTFVNVTINQSNSTTTINSNQIFVTGNLGTTGTDIVAGTTTFVLSGTGTLSTNTSGVLRNNLTINTSGTVTFLSTVNYNTGIITYTAGTVVSTSSTLNAAASTTFNTGGISWTNFSTGGSTVVYTLLSNLNIGGLLTLGSNNLTFSAGANIFNPTGAVLAGGTTTFPNNIAITNLSLGTATGNVILNGNAISITGNLTTTGGLSSIGGTSTLALTGTGTWSTGNVNRIFNNLIINTAGTLTISGNVYHNTGTLTYTAGTVIVSGSALNCNAATTFNTSGMSWNNVTLSAGNVTFTMSSNLNLNGTLNLSGSGTVTLSGSTINTAGLTINTNAIVIGTALIIFNGTGTWLHTGLGVLRNNVTINTSGTLTISNVNYNTGTLTYTAGTVIISGALTVSTSTLATDGINWVSVSATGILTLSNNFTITGSLSVPQSSALSFVLNGNSLITTTANITLNGASSFSVPQNITCVNLNCPGSAGCAVNGNQISITGNISYNNNFGAVVGGTCLLVMSGTGTLSGNGQIANNLTFNTVGTITISGLVGYRTGTLTYTAGTIITTGSTLQCGANTTLATNGMVWNNVALSGASQTFTMSNNLNVGGILTLSGTTSLTLTGNIINVASLLSNTTAITSGTSTIVFNGTGTWTNSSSGALRNNLTFNTAGTVTLTGGLHYNTGTLTYTAGTIVTTNSTLFIPAATTFATDGMTWGTIAISNNISIVLSNNLSATAMTLANNTTFATSGFTVGTLTISTAGTTQQLVSNATNAINTALNCTAATNASRVLIRSTTPGTKALLNLSPGATQDLGFVNATDINSNGGKKIYSYKATLSNTDNWATLPTDPFAEASAMFVN